jgi:tRNA U54 and U55 pseudouridine synthase Pus10
LGIFNKNLGKAFAALEFDICDRCLGRLFATMGFGLITARRGLSISGGLFEEKARENMISHYRITLLVRPS